MAAPKTTKTPPATGNGSGALQRKLGPFSVAGWAGIGAVGLVLGLLVRRSGLFRGAAPAAPAPDPSAVTAGPGAAASLPLFVQTAPAGSSTPAPPRDNGEWRKWALETLVAEGKDTIASQQAIALFLDGKPLTDQQAALVAIAIRMIGPPPEYVPPMTITPGGADVPSGAVAGVNLSALDDASLIVQGSERISSGQDWRPWSEEAIRRVAAGSLSVNSPAWREPSGYPRALWWPVQRALFDRGIARW